MGQREREHDVVESGSGGDEDEKIGALSSMHLVDACCIAKAYVNAGIAQGMQVRVFIVLQCLTKSLLLYGCLSSIMFFSFHI